MPQEQNSVDLLVTYALDLLAQTEAQHRGVCRAQSQLDALRRVEGDTVNAAAPSRHGRRPVLTAIKRELKELISVVRSEQLLLKDMHAVIVLLESG